jgi:plasmid replication initiation protein
MKNTTTTEKNIVKFHNDVNKVAFTGFTKREMSVFISIVKLIDDQEDKEIVISFNKLKKVMGVKFESMAVFIQTLEDTVDKLLSIRATIKEDDGTIIAFVPFIVFKIIPAEQCLRVRVNPEYTYLFNMLTKNFTYFDVVKFNKLKTKYSQRLFQLLKQYRTTGRLYVPMEDFRRLFEVPEAYDNSKISVKVITPSIKELESSFKGLTVNKIRTGRFITAYEFTFVPEPRAPRGTARPETLTSKEPENTSLFPDTGKEEPLTIEGTARVVTSNETAIPAGKLFCPHCGKELVRRVNKENGNVFWGHKYYKMTNCQKTYGSVTEIEAEWAEIHKKKESEAQKRAAAENAWENVVQQQKALFEKIKK